MNTNLSANAIVTCADSNLYSGGTMINCDYVYPLYNTWYPYWHVCEKSRIEQAFKIIGKLMESKIIEKELTVKDFMKLVNDIANII